jgi:hypothetical protein
MNTLLQRPPANPLAEFSSEDPVVAVRLVIADLIPILLWYPENNRGGTHLLCRLLEARVESTPAGVRSAVATLPFNCSFYLFTLNASPVGPALEAIRDELCALNLLPFSQIAWHDPREGIFRMFHPAEGDFLVPSEEERQADIKWFNAAKAALESGTPPKTNG